jgi:hypothetical protein|tara:strand:+ start:209 stop:502 length:294 start_codon:yes stop_codon:yes gene_type:complete
MASYEVNLLLKYTDETYGSIGGHIFLSDPDDTAKLIDEIKELIFKSKMVCKNFNSMCIIMTLNEDQILEMTLYNHNNQILQRDDLCRVIIPDRMTKH